VCEELARVNYGDSTDVDGDGLSFKIICVSFCEIFAGALIVSIGSSVVGLLLLLFTPGLAACVRLLSR